MNTPSINASFVKQPAMASAFVHLPMYQSFPPLTISLLLQFFQVIYSHLLCKDDE